MGEIDWFALVFFWCVCFSFGFLKGAGAYHEKIAEEVSVKSQRLHFNYLSHFLLETHSSLYIYMPTYIKPSANIFSKKLKTKN